ncbi:dihydrofolate reductase family protein [Bdellovibrio bacteriovorus]|uniref:dihydrofolate reductase family protein n=1 Tax=Bdellovibrio bacteriovorus TaxID=959 RepID=UPI0035A93192
MISGHVFIATSLDGYIAKSDGGIDWLLRRDDPSEDHGYNNFIKDIDGLIMGRGSFEKALTFDPWPYAIPVVVMSKTLKPEDVPTRLKGKVRLVDLTPTQVMKSLENEGWRKAYVDGGQIIQSFLREKLIVDMVITTAPVLLGEGRRLFGFLNEEVSLTHIKTTAFPSGLVQSTYTVNK